MSEDAKAEEMVDSMRDAFTGNIREAIKDLPAHHALQLADSLCAVWLDQLAGMRVTHRARAAIDGEAIAEDWARGRTLAEIRLKHSCSKATAYRYHPTKSKGNTTAKVA